MKPAVQSIGYGVGDFGMNLFWNSLSLLLLFYYTQVLGLPPRDAGVIFFIGTVWDAFTDPIMAAIAERTRTRWGSYRPYLPFGGAVLCAAFIGLMAPIAWDGAVMLPALLIFHLIFRTSYTLVGIPYSALSTRITDDGRERVILSGMRMFFALLGNLAIAALTFPIVRAAGDGSDTSQIGFFWFACLCALVAYFCFLLSFFFTKEKVGAASSPISLRASVKSAIQSLRFNRALHTMVAIVFCQAAASLIFAATLAFFVDVHAVQLRSKEEILGANAAIMLLAVPVWTTIAHLFGKRRAWIGASIIIIGAGLHLGGARVLIVDGWALQVFAMAFGFGAFGVLIWSMVPDTVEYGAWKTGVRSEAAAFGITLFVQKLSIGTAGLLIGLVLEAIGYSTAPEEATARMADAIRMMMGAGPALLMAVCLVPLVCHPVNRVSHKAARAALRRGAHAKGND